jgi:hypothetical protein
MLETVSLRFQDPVQVVVCDEVTNSEPLLEEAGHRDAPVPGTQ